MNSLRVALVALLLSWLAGCSWWDTEEQIKPAGLTSFADERTVTTLWSSKLGAGLGQRYNALRPAVLGNRIYASDVEGNLFALERETGKTIWRLELGVDVSGALGIGDGKLLVATNDGRLLAFKALDGAPLWTAKLSSESVSAPQANTQVVLVQTIDGRLTAFSPKTGEQLWVYNAQIPALTLRGTSTPLLTRQAVFAGFSNGKIVALDIRNGNLAWEARVAVAEGKTELERMVDVDGELLLSGNLLYVSSYQGRLAAISANDGRILWSRPLSSYRGIAETLSQLYASDAEGNVIAFEKSNGLEYWKQDGLFYRQSTAPAVISNTVVVADFEGYVHFIDPQDGRFVARKRVDSSGVRGPLLVRDEVLYVYGNSGRLTAIMLQ